VQRRDVAAQVEFESKSRKQFLIFQFQEDGSRRFQHSFERVNLHRPTAMCVVSNVVRSAAAQQGP